MASLQQDNEVRSQLQGALEELAGITASALARQDLGPDLSFESGVIFFSRTLRLFHGLHEADLQDLPFQKMSDLLTAAKRVRVQLRQIQEFSLQKYSSNPLAVRDQFINEVRDSYDDIFNTLAPIIAFTVRKGTDFERLEEQARVTLKRIDASAAEHEKALKVARSDADQLVKEVRQIAQEAGVSQQAFYFKQEADQHEASAKPWLKATVWLAGSTVVVGVLLILFFSAVTNLTPTQNLQLAISKIVVILVLLSATFWAGRTYRAHRHNAVINRHRQNALTTFQTFAKAASDEPTKNAVLLQATQCIFSPQQTGYVQGESEVGTFPQILEIVRNLGGPKG